MGRELKDLCHQRVVPQGKKLQGREGKGLWVILSPGIRGMRAVDKEGLFVDCRLVLGLTRVPDFLFVETVSQHLCVTVKYEH